MIASSTQLPARRGEQTGIREIADDEQLLALLMGVELPCGIGP